ncbi:hypothetical protein HYX12_02805 [Candidatus Woesearchaeota archaeon]|nr:hypothetical protein [Candidatus Woesearchaeota archaeon]
MEIKDLKSNSGNVDIVAQVVDKAKPRSFEKFGKKGQVCNATLEDETGKVTLTLWNEEVEKVNVGDKIHIQNGWCSEYQGQKQISAGKFGKIEIIEASAGMNEKKQVFTNDPGMLNQASGLEEESPSDEENEMPEMEELEE